MNRAQSRSRSECSASILLADDICVRLNVECSCPPLALMNIPRLKEFLFAPLCLCRDFANRRRAILLLIFAFSAALPSSATCPQQHLGIIVLPSQPRASALLEQLRNGWDFGVLAKENSIDPTGNEGGYLGRFAPDELRPQLRGAVTGIHPGQFSDVVRIPSGYAFLTVFPRSPITSEVDRHQINSMATARVIRYGVDLGGMPGR
jgi:hypothetical protein